MRRYCLRFLAALAGVLGACLSSTGPRLVTGDGLVLELIVPSDTVMSGGRFTLTVRLRNDGQVPMVLSGGRCLAHHTIRLGGREVGFPFTGSNFSCSAVPWSFTLEPGEESLSNLETIASLGADVDLPAAFTVYTELFFDLTVNEQTVRPKPKLRDTFVIGPGSP